MLTKDPDALHPRHLSIKPPPLHLPFSNHYYSITHLSGSRANHSRASLLCASRPASSYVPTDCSASRAIFLSPLNIFAAAKPGSSNCAPPLHFTQTHAPLPHNLPPPHIQPLQQLGSTASRTCQDRAQTTRGRRCCVPSGRPAAASLRLAAACQRCFRRGRQHPQAAETGRCLYL